MMASWVNPEYGVRASPAGRAVVNRTQVRFRPFRASIPDASHNERLAGGTRSRARRESGAAMLALRRVPF
jgi:hypothetical protein